MSKQVSYLRDDLGPSTLLSEETSDAVWDALQEIGSGIDPFTVMGILDIALHRAEGDSRYSERAIEAIERLSAQEFINDAGVNIYDYMPAVISMVTEQLHYIEGVADQPAYWRRLCAWTHAGLLIRLMNNMSLDANALTEWCQSFQSQAGVIKDLADLRSDPVWPRDGMTPRTLRGEIIGRLQGIKARYETAGREIPAGVTIDSAISNLISQDAGLTAWMPGPLEGHRTPSSYPRGREYPDKDVAMLREHLSPDLTTVVWWRLAIVSQVFVLKQEHLEDILDHLQETEFGDTVELRRRAYANLANVCLIAAAHRNHKLADAVANRCVAATSKVVDPEEVLELLSVLLIASAAIEKASDYSDWLENAVFRFVSALPKGNLCQTVHDDIQMLRKFVPLPYGALAPVEALARLGV